MEPVWTIQHKSDDNNDQKIFKKNKYKQKYRTIFKLKPRLDFGMKKFRQIFSNLFPIIRHRLKISIRFSLTNTYNNFNFEKKNIYPSKLVFFK